MYKVLVSRTFQKQFNNLSKYFQKRIKTSLKKEDNPYDSDMDIKPLTETTPQKHRLRIGNYQIIFVMENEVVKIIEIFRRGRGYRV